MSHTIMGCDVSSKDIAYCIFGEDVLDCGFLKDQGHLYDLLLNHGVTALYIEEVPYVKNMRTVISLGEAVGRLQQMCISAGREYNMISVARWKMLAVGNGGAKKEQVKNIIVATTELLDGEKQDIYDACGISIAGLFLEKEKEIAERNE